MEERKGILSTLFDFTFSEMLTTRIVTTLYFLCVIGATMGALGLVSAGYAASYKTAGLIGAVLLFFITVTASRLALEAVVVLFRIAEYTKELAENTRPEK